MNLATWLAADNGRKQFPDLGAQVANALAADPSLANLAQLQAVLPADLQDQLLEAHAAYGVGSMPWVGEFEIPWRATRPY